MLLEQAEDFSRNAGTHSASQPPLDLQEWWSSSTQPTQNSRGRIVQLRVSGVSMATIVPCIARLSKRP